MSPREEALAGMILRMVDHGRQCNWFADGGDDRLVMEALALANGHIIHQCSDDECGWRGPETETVEHTPRSKRLKCPECGSFTDPERL